jgi:hypothetical protein
MTIPHTHVSFHDTVIYNISTQVSFNDTVIYDNSTHSSKF